MFTTGRNATVTKGVLTYLAWRRIRQRERRLARFQEQNPRYTGTGRGGHNKTEGEVKADYETYTAEDYARSSWGKMLRKLEDNPLDVKVNKDFVYDFRVPYTMFLEIVNRVKDEPWARNHVPDPGLPRPRGRPSHVPIEFKVMMALYRLGSGCLPRTACKLFLMTRSYSDEFFKKFCSFYAQLYHDFCTVPSTHQEMQDVESVYRRMGLPGYESPPCSTFS
jgi:hypothetical protein